MGRGRLTQAEMSSLSENPYVLEVTPREIKYTEEFKLLFLKEYYEGKKPTRIFMDAGFDIALLGTKRIERCCARWREANASGNLGEKYEANDFYEHYKTDNERMMLDRMIKEQAEEIKLLKQQISQLERAAGQEVGGRLHIDAY